MPKIRIVAAVIDTKQLSLYKEDGTTIRLPQGDPRIQPILDQVTPIVSQGQVATIELEPSNSFQEFAAKSNGLVRFFRTTKQKFSSFFNSSHTDEPEVAKAQLDNAIADIMSNAKAVGDDDFVQADTTTNDTIVAVLNTPEGRKVVPGMENLKDQFAYASRLGSTKGVENFLKRISAVIEKRQHSIHDLLRFMERGDLPIADDGSIIIYKVLKLKDQDPNLYVDCHTGNVPQRVGSYVCMDEKLVDHNRRVDCSNGLHVARRGYIKSFSGDVCVLAKLAPEDVIAVPEYDSDKMRVCGYHIIFKLTSEQYRLLQDNKAMTSDESAQRMLARAISGDHIGKIEEVRITQNYGGGVVITKLDAKGRVSTKPTAKATKPVKAIESQDGCTAPAVDPKLVAKQVTSLKTTTSPRHIEAHRLLSIVVDSSKTTNARRTAAQQLIAFKKKAKVGWDRLSILETQVELIQSVAKLPDDPKPAKVKKPAAKKVKPLAAYEPKAPKPGSNQEAARALFAEGQWKALANFKKAKKKSWAALSFIDSEIAEIKLHIGD